MHESHFSFGNTGLLSAAIVVVFLVIMSTQRSIMALSGTTASDHVQRCVDEAALSRFDDDGSVRMMTPEGRMITQEVQLMPFNSLTAETLIVVFTELAGGRPSAIKLRTMIVLLEDADRA